MILKKSLLIVSGVFCISSGVHAAVSEVGVPCAEDAGGKSATGAAYLRKCSEVLGAVKGQKGYTGPSGVLPLLDEQVKKLVDAPERSLYRGENPDPDNTDPSITHAFGTPVCNPVPNPYFNSSKAELETNHLGESCGEPFHFKVNASSSGVVAKMYTSGKYGTREGAYLRGSWVQALTCYWQQVKTEISSSRKLKINPACSAIGDAMAELSAGSADIASTMNKQLGSSKSLSEIWKCEATELEKGSPGDPDVGKLRQKAQQLCAARASFETLFTQLAMCEVTTRAGKAYRRLASSPDQFLDQLKEGAARTCNKRCNSQCSGCASSLSGAAARCSSCGTQCANQCYPGELAKFYAEKIRGWPSNGSCSL